MTMDFSKDEVEYISLALQTGPVTFNGVSNDLKIHIIKSKQLLYNYYQSNKDQLSASFIATGTRQGSYLVKLLHGEDEANKAKQYFDQLDCVHIYSLASVTNSFSDNEMALYELNHSVSAAKINEPHALGTIRGPELTATSQPVKTQPAPVTTRASPPAVQRDSKAEAESSAPKKKMEYVSRKEKPALLLLSNYVSRKGEKRAVESAKPKAVTKPAYQYKSRKVEQNQPKERVVISLVEPDSEMDVDQPPISSAEPKSDINKLFLDDLSDFDDDDEMAVDHPDQPIVAEPIAVGEKETQAEVESQKVSAPQLPEDSVFRSLATKTSATEPEIMPEPENTKTVVDEDGYITTYRAKPAAKSAVVENEKRVPVTKRKTDTDKKKTDGKKKQASLMSFFGKR